MGNLAPIVDRPVLNQLTADVGVESAAFLLTSLKREIENTETALKDHLAEGDLEQFEIKAHALKSAARSFGAMRLGDLCMDLEAAAREGRAAADLKAMLDRFALVSAETLIAFDQD